MLSLPPSVRIWAASAPADMRKGIDGLAALVRDELKGDPLSGHLFVFRGKRANRVKVLYWDRSGYCLWLKRLEHGSFRFPEAGDASFEMEAADLGLILEGIELSGARRRARFVPGRGIVK
jgi:transposase